MPSGRRKDRVSWAAGVYYDPRQLRAVLTRCRSSALGPSDVCVVARREALRAAFEQSSRASLLGDLVPITLAGSEVLASRGVPLAMLERIFEARQQEFTARHRLHAPVRSIADHVAEGAIVLLVRCQTANRERNALRMLLERATGPVASFELPE